MSGRPVPLVTLCTRLARLDAQWAGEWSRVPDAKTRRQHWRHYRRRRAALVRRIRHREAHT